MHFSNLALAFSTILPLLSASPLPDAPKAGGGALNLCWGCIEASSCTGRVGDLVWGEGDTDAQPQLSMAWMSQFGDMGNTLSNGDAIDRGMCCREWCLIIENTSAGSIDYSREDAQSSVDETNSNKCSKWYSRTGDSDYLKIVAVSNVYSGANMQNTVQTYGDWCAGAPVVDGPPPIGGGFQ